MRESREQRRLAAPGRMQALQCDSVPRAGVRGVLQQGAWGRPRRVCEDRLPPRLLVLQPAPPPRARGWPCRGGAVGSPGAQPLPQGHDAHALALAYPVKQGVALRPQRLRHGRRKGPQCLRERVEGVAQAGAHSGARNERPPSPGRAGKAVGEPPCAPPRRLLRRRGALHRALGLGQSRGTGRRGGAQMPADPATDEGRQLPVRCQTAAVFAIRQALRGEGHRPPGAHRDQTLRAKGTKQAGEGQQGAREAPRAARQTEATMDGQQRLARPQVASRASARPQAAGPCRRLCREGMAPAQWCARPDGDGRRARGACGDHARSSCPWGGAASRAQGGQRGRTRPPRWGGLRGHSRSSHRGSRRCSSGAGGSVEQSVPGGTRCTESR